jgi:transcriptional repressor NrdR
VENIVEMPLKVVKKDESREPFEPKKIRVGLEKACYKRPISTDEIETVVRLVEREVYASFFGEVPSCLLGEMVMNHLKKLDQVAYVRFASVYRQFKDVSEFVEEVEPMLGRGRNGVSPKRRKRRSKSSPRAD